MPIPEEQEICKYAKYRGSLQSLRCEFDGECRDKIKVGDGYNCRRTVLLSQDQLMMHEIKAMTDEVRRDSPSMLNSRRKHV